jgi:osmoprotectant transport system substrate-binding protein
LRAIVGVRILLSVALLSCTSGGSATAPAGPPSGGPRLDDAVVVASFNFSESTLLAEIYAQALERADIRVRRELNLGPRELVQAAVAQGFVDVVPEYLGTALRSLDPSSAVDPADAVAVRAALDEAASGWGAHVLTPAVAQDQNGFVVTRALADELGLRSLSDLGPHASRLVLGGPAECPTRPFCLLGLRSVYGLQFAQFVPLATLGQELTALQQGVIDVAVMFTTDGRLGDAGLVLLADDRDLQPAENVVPMVTQRALDRYGTRLVDALNMVSSRLTSANLRFLNWRLDVAGRDVTAEASGWLSRHQSP